MIIDKMEEQESNTNPELAVPGEVKEEPATETESSDIKEEPTFSTPSSPSPSISSSSPSLANSTSFSSAPSPLTSPSTTASTTTTSLFQPFLSSSNSASQQHPASRPALPFSIDNILKPTFGQRLLLHSLAAAAVAHHHQQQQQQQHLRQHFLVENSTVKHEPPTSPPSKDIAAASSNNNNQPVDLTSKRTSSVTSGNGDSAEPSPPIPGKTNKTDPDVPPGMVRGPNGQLWPAWVFCTRYSDRPSSGPRSRKIKKPGEKTERVSAGGEKRPRTAFSAEQLSRLKREFEDNRYLTEERRRNLAETLGLNENQIKIWFQNKRAKLKKSSGQKGELAQMLAAQGLYNHSTIPVDEDDNPLY